MKNSTSGQCDQPQTSANSTQSSAQCDHCEPAHWPNCSTETAVGSATPELDLPRQRRQIRPWEDAQLEQRLSPEANASNSKTETKPVDQRVARRWDRLARLLGEAGVKKLLGSHVTVFGLGGVGGYAVEALARSAVGRLTIVDFDDVCVTNVNRQIQAFPGTVGQSKANLLAERVRAINPDIEVDPVQAFYDPTTSKALLAPKPDFVVDAIDNVTAKLHLLTTCLRDEIPVVSVTGSGAKLDPTQVRIDDISKTRVDPLAKVVRKELSRRGFDTTQHVGLPVVYSAEPSRQPVAPSWDKDGFRCICPHGEESPHECEKRRMIYGTAGFVTAAFGMAAASKVVQDLTRES